MTYIRGTGLTRPGTETHDYTWRGEPEPPEVTAARERWRACSAEIDAMAEAMPDAAPGYEWYRESRDDDE